MDNINSKKISIILHDRLNKSHILVAEEGQTLSSFLKKNYIPRDAVIAKINETIIDDDSYILTSNEKLTLYMVRAYQLPEYCKMLQLWETNNDVEDKDNNDAIYSKKILWFNENGICELKKATFTRDTFTEWMDNNFVEGILSKNLIVENEEICLALSGGRDSLALLYLLSRNKHRLPSFKLVGATVANSAASENDVEIAKEAMANLGLHDYSILPLDYLNETMNFKNSFKNAIDSTLHRSGLGRSISLWHCIMRANVERFARERGIKKIAFGYQHEDLLASVFRGSTLGVLFGESVQMKNWGDFTLISPLWTVTKKELSIYLELIAPAHHSSQGSPTDYDRGDHNRDINYFIADLLSSIYPGIGFSMFESLSQLHENYNISKPNFYNCKNCGITYNDRYVKGQAIDVHYCEHCLYLQKNGEINKFRIVA